MSIGHRSPERENRTLPEREVVVLDVVYVVAAAALFALVALVAKAVEKL